MARALSRDEVEVILGELGAWEGHQQLRALSRSDLNRLMNENARLLGTSKATGEYLPLSGFEFAEHVDLNRVNLEHADLHSSRLKPCPPEESPPKESSPNGACLRARARSWVRCEDTS
jgi:hypothetical protein